METFVNKRMVVVWLLLVAITVAYLWVDHSASNRGVLTASTAVTVIAIGLALAKVWIVMREFMEVRHAPAVLRRLTNLWVVLMAAALLTAYFAGKAVG